MSLLDKQNFYLVGIKGVAMTALAQCLLDAGKKVSGTDLAEKFVTQKILDKLELKIDIGFDHDISNNIDCLIYTAAHNGPDNKLVKQAKLKNILVISHAEALAELFNNKKGIAVCGVGGKSTVSAMIAWIFEKTKTPNSFAVGVGDIIGLNKTGQFNNDSEYFIAEADEYVVDPAAREKGEEIVARFSYLKPYINICTNLKFDHPDVYENFDHTKEVFLKFFKNIKPNGYLIVNQDDTQLTLLAKEVAINKKLKVITYGEHTKSDLQLISKEKTHSILLDGDKFDLTLQTPGLFNVKNAMAAILACRAIEISYKDSTQALESFRSTKRRFEYIGEKGDVKYYDDYAHHPAEVKAVIESLNNLYPSKRIVYAFQSHTFSRTKELFDDFVDSFAKAKEVVMIDIFASAREKSDPSVSSDLLCQKITEKYPSIKTKNLKSKKNLAEFCKNKLEKNNIFITLGAGDIYEVHKKI